MENGELIIGKCGHIIPNIVVVSMVRNEADIIESFVRHNLQFADRLYIVNHRSSDATKDILQQLLQEGLPIVLQECGCQEQAQAEVMTHLAKLAAEDGADLILPLDADEFLIGDAGRSMEGCREILDSLTFDRVYALDWVHYQAKPCEAFAGNPFVLDCEREKEAEELQKIVLGACVLKETKAYLTQGNHCAAFDTEQGTERILPEKIRGVHIAHFPWRSEEQAAVKAAIGWLANVAKYSPYTNTAHHWHADYRRLMQGGSVLLPVLKEPVPAVFSRDCRTVQLHYTEKMHPGSFITALLTAGEAMAAGYQEAHMQLKHQLVTVLLPFWGDFSALQCTLQNIREQTYPFYEIIIFTLLPDEFSEIQSLPEDLIFVQNEDVDQLIRMIDTVVRGEYIQWVFPEDKLMPEKIAEMAAALDSQPDISFILSNAVPTKEGKRRASAGLQTDLNTGEEGFLVGDGTELWQALLQNGMLLSGGIAGGLFRRKTMAEHDWMLKCFIDARPMLLSMWHELLPGSVIGGFESPVLRADSQLRDANDILWLQLEWFYLLQDSRKPVVQAEHLLREKQPKLEQLLQKANPAILQQYEDICGKG